MALADSIDIIGTPFGADGVTESSVSLYALAVLSAFAHSAANLDRSLWWDCLLY